MKIVIKEGPNAGQELDVQDATTLGRDPASAQLVIEDPEASRRHATITPSGSGAAVEDLGSTNGTFVNGQRVEGSTEVGPGDEIRIGNTVLEVQTEVEVTRMAEIPDAPPDDATAFDAPAPAPDAAPPAPEPAAYEPPPAPEPPAHEPPPAYEPPPPAYDEPTETAPPAPGGQPAAAPVGGYGGEPPPPAYEPPPPAYDPPPPPPGAEQGYGAPAQGYDQGYADPGYQQPPADYGQPGGPIAPYPPGAGGPMEVREPNKMWVLCALVPFYSLYHIHRTNKELEAWSGGRIDYNAGATMCAFIFAGFTFGISAIVAISSYMGRVRTAQQMAGLPPQANFWGFIGRAFLLGYCWKWLQDQFNEIAVRQPQG